MSHDLNFLILTSLLIYSVCGGTGDRGCKKKLTLDYKVHLTNPYCRMCYHKAALQPGGRRLHYLFYLLFFLLFFFLLFNFFIFIHLPVSLSSSHLTHSSSYFFLPLFFSYSPSSPILFPHFPFNFSALLTADHLNSHHLPLHNFCHYHLIRLSPVTSSPLTTLSSPTPSSPLTTLYFLLNLHHSQRCPLLTFQEQQDGMILSSE